MKITIKILLALGCAASFVTSAASADETNKLFSRIATFPVYLNTDIHHQTVAEIVAASKDGKTLVYTDGVMGNLGFVDITDPTKPQAAGVIAVGGEPTSVAVAGDYALVAVNSSASYVVPSGHLQVVDLLTRRSVKSFDLGGQPDSVAVSPDGRYAAVVIENERDEDLGDGAPPQVPAGFMVIVDLVGPPTHWSMRKLGFTGLAGMLYAGDPEPEYVDINRNNIAVVTLQENNHIALVDLARAEVINHFSAGRVNLSRIDTRKNKLIELNGTLIGVPREPDGASWISNFQFATADEGDLHGGSRGFTIFNTDGSVAYAAGNALEHTMVRSGHFPEKRAGKKGNEPENVEYGHYGRDHYLFVASERANVVLVYTLSGKPGKTPRLRQILPAAVKPEGLLAIPQRGLLVAAAEEDARADKIRSALTIYKLGKQANYPTVVANNRADGTPIPWGALSGLAMDQDDEDTVYTIQDSFYRKSRILVMDVDHQPARITGEIVLQDALGKLAAVDPGRVNGDGTVDLDPEGIASRKEGGFWIASEGKGSRGDLEKPFETFNLLLRVSKRGVIEQVVTLPDNVNARQKRFGFEGVTSVGKGDKERVYVAFQREWRGDPKRHVRIGRYQPATGEWRFFYYPLEVPRSAYGGWVGLSELAYLGNNKFAVIERDNQAGPDAALKRIYKFSIANLTPVSDSGGTPDFPVLKKVLVRDLIPDLKTTGGLVLEKIEGLAVSKNGDALVINDNDGVDDSNGETRLLRLQRLFKGKHD